MAPILIFRTAVATGAVVALLVTCRLLRPAGRRRWWWELLGAGFVLTAALTTIRPYLRLEIVGAGDAQHYALQLADMFTQLRQGVFPVFVGQSRFGFNGNIHTLRTAPYYVHLGALLDVLTAHRLPVGGVQNLAIALTAVAAGLAAYFAARRSGLNSVSVAALLAALFITSPAVIGPMVGRDMVAAFMAMPWLPLLMLGCTEMVRHGDRLWPALLASGALGVIWLAHPPSAVFCTPIVAAAFGWQFFQYGGQMATWRRAGVAAASGAGIAAYVFASVHSLALPSLAASLAGFAAQARADFLSVRLGLLKPVTLGAGTVTDLQPGYALLGLALLGLLGWRRRERALRFCMIVFAAYVLFFFAGGPVVGFLWRAVPDAAAVVVSPWPHQRLMPVLAALILVWSARTLAAWPLQRLRWALAVGGVLGIGLVWSLGEAAKFRGAEGNLPAASAMADPSIHPGSAALGRSSYLLFGFFPEYFSHGYMEPAFELRLLDEQLHVALTNAGFLTHQPDPVVAVDWQPVQPAALVPLQPGRSYLLEFRLALPDASGELTIEGENLRRIYGLPVSGEAKGFGSTLEASHTLAFLAGDLQGRQLQVRTSAPGVSMRALAFDPAALPLALESLVPLAVTVQAPAAGFLETPRVFVPGYAATVNGVPARVGVSPAGLVMVPVPPGSSKVRLDYPGTPLLHAAFWLTTAVLIGWLIAMAWLLGRTSEEPIGRDDGPGVREPARVFWKWANRDWRRSVGILAGAGLVTAAVVWACRPRLPVDGVISLSVEFGRLPPEKTCEPLLVLGHAGAADVIYVEYDAPGQARLGYDHWGRGGPRTEPFRISPGQPIRISIRTPSLMSSARAARTAPVTFTVEGKTYLSASLPWYRIHPREIVLGRNSIGASSCGSAFSGRLQRLPEP